MAPRLDLLDSSFIIEFKPRTGTWASSDVWSQSKLPLQQQQQQQQQQTSRKSVRFSRTNPVQTQDYIHRSEYTVEEKKACWYKRSDYQKMREHNDETIYKLAHSMPLQESTECHFGLETRIPREHLRCYQVMRYALLAVLDEQDDQFRCDGYLNDELLAARYMSCTWEARDRAQALGQSQCLASSLLGAF